MPLQSLRLKIEELEKVHTNHCWNCLFFSIQFGNLSFSSFPLPFFSSSIVLFSFLPFLLASFFLSSVFSFFHPCASASLQFRSSPYVSAICLCCQFISRTCLWRRVRTSNSSRLSKKQSTPHHPHSVWLPRTLHLYAAVKRIELYHSRTSSHLTPHTPHTSSHIHTTHSTHKLHIHTTHIHTCRLYMTADCTIPAHTRSHTHATGFTWRRVAQFPPALSQMVSCTTTNFARQFFPVNGVFRFI